MPSDPLHVIQISDPHLLAEPNATYNGVDTMLTLQRVLTHIQQHTQPDLILLSGDIAQDELPETYQRLLDLLAPINAPILALPGNHDNLQHIAHLTQQVPQWHTQQWQNHHWNIIALDSNGPGQYQYSSSIHQAELDRLAHCLSQNTNPTLVALHHPPIDMAHGWSDQMLLDNRQALQHIIQQHQQVRAVVWGHVHCAWDHHEGNIQWLSCPSSYALFTVAAPQFTPMPNAGIGYRHLRLYANGSLSHNVVLLQD